MIQIGDPARSFSLPRLDGRICREPPGDGRPTLLVFFEADCPTCRLALPYLDRLAERLGLERDAVIGISQDDERATRRLVESLRLRFPVLIDARWEATRLYDPVAVPTLVLVGGDGRVARAETGWDKGALNGIAARLGDMLGLGPISIAPPHDGAPERKPGCASRHLEPESDVALEPSPLDAPAPVRASRLEVDPAADPYEYCLEAFGDPLPVVPPTLERVEHMLGAARYDPTEVIGRVPPNYGAATVEKIAANAVMAGCRPEMMRVLIATVRAACDERFNLHGIQATTHFAAPLVIVNGPVRRELGFASGSNVFSNVARANSTLGRALALILANIGGARPGGIDMSTLGNPGKFSYCIAESEEESSWEPLHVERGFGAEQSAVTLFGAEPPRGVSEHSARSGREVLRAIGHALATVWSYRVCGASEAVVVLCPEHFRTLRRDGFTKQDARAFLFENTGVPVSAYREGDTGEGTQRRGNYTEAVIDGAPCYLKFREPEAIKLVVAGGTAGKFSAVIGSWATGARGSQMVTYPIE